MFRSPWEWEQLNHEHIDDLLMETTPRLSAPASLASRALTNLRHGLGRAFIGVGERLADRDPTPTLPPGGVTTAFNVHL